MIGGVASVLAMGLAAVMLAFWLRERRAGRPVAAVGIALAFSVVIATASGSWLAYQRHEKCDRTVARKLCESPVDWFGSR